MEPRRPRNTALQIRRKIYMELSQLLAKLIPAAGTPLSQDELQALHIRCSAMALCPDDDPDSGPLFCKLVSPGTMSKAFDSTFTSDYTIQWPGYNPEMGRSDFYSAYAVGGTLLDYTESGQFIRKPLIDTEWYRTGDTTRALSLHRNYYTDIHGWWGICQILRLNNSHQPHLACVHTDDALPEDGLHASEMISAIKLMKQGMRLDKRGQFRIYPVYVYSFCHQARVLETFYDSGTFFVKKTALIDFAEESRENIQLYLRWMMNKPCGLTTSTRENDSDNVSDISDNPESARIHSSRNE